RLAPSAIVLARLDAAEKRHRTGEGDLQRAVRAQAPQLLVLADDAEPSRCGNRCRGHEVGSTIVARYAEPPRRWGTLEAAQPIVHFEDEAHAAQFAVADHVEACFDLVRDRDSRRILEGFFDVRRAGDALAHALAKVEEPAGR